METPLIEFKDVYKAFDGNAVLKGVNLTILKGQVTAIIGKSGTGKSVLLKHIVGLLQPDSGQVLIDGQPLTGMDRIQQRQLKKRCSYMFQNNALFDSMTIYDNIALPLVERDRLRGESVRQRVQTKMAQLDIVDIERKYPSQLSGGMKKRVAMARALITEPEIVLFDEPTTGLDPIRKKAAYRMITDYQQRFGFTGVLVSHDIPDIFFISHQIAMLDEGQIIFEGGCREIQASQDPVVKEFVGGMSGVYQ
ncbi:ABC transporter ATP-binding protein [Desulfatitalea tepidiphila]|uniref:ABC transporter ATP-binding protein n=1 Tax=Desulfatitalea tepidiphila TaxID=1185843 RepID=UPI0006B542EB|nr:ATP-binding cassette domain-containing protein [Desulfatitalea tepidiphila]